MPLALWQSAAHGQPFAGYGALGVAGLRGLGIRSLLCLRDGRHRLASAAQFAWWLVWPLVASLLLAWLPGQFEGMGDGWQAALVALPWLLVAALALYRWRWLSMPLGAVSMAGAAACWRCCSWCWACGGWYRCSWPVTLAAAVAAGAQSDGARATGGAGAGTALAGAGRRARCRRRGSCCCPALAFAWITSVVLHAVHHWGGVAWNDGLVSSSLAQTSLTVVWSVLGVLGWVLGSRRGQRMLWLAGAVLMGVVLAKLVLVDRQHLGNLLGIGSFIAYGLLCTVVGYLAPAPPRRNDGAEEAVA